MKKRIQISLMTIGLIAVMLSNSTLPILKEIVSENQIEKDSINPLETPSDPADNEIIEKRDTNLGFNISYNSENQIGFKNEYNLKSKDDDIITISNKGILNPSVDKFASKGINDIGDDNKYHDNYKCNDWKGVTGLFKANALIQKMIKQKPILFHDVFESIQSDPIEARYSDTITFNSQIFDIRNQSVPEKEVIYYIFNYTEKYPEFIKNNQALAKIYDKIWFSLYFYETFYNQTELYGCLNKTKVGRELLHLRDILIESFKIHEIGSAITNGQGIARLNRLAYYNPGRYHMITLANLENFPSFINRTNSIFDYYRYKFFYNNVTIKLENTQIAPVDLTTRYSDVSDLSIKLTDDEENPIPQPDDVDPSFRKLEYSIFLGEEWKLIDEVETDEYGIATINIIPWLEPGNYPLRVNFTGDSYYNESSSIFDLIVQKENTELEFSKVYSINNTDLITLKTRFSDDENNTIPQPEDVIKDNRSISYYIYVDGEWELIGSTKVDLNGSAELETSFLLPLGFYTLKAEFIEDSFYLGTEILGIIEINRESTLIGDFPSLEVQTTDTVLFSAELTDNELEPISRKEISFEVFMSGSWTQLATATTKEDGIGSSFWQASLSPGIYAIRAKFYEDEYFKGFEKRSSTQIRKEDTKLELSGKVSNDQGNYDLVARLLEDDLTPTPIKGEEIEIWVDGTKFDRTTDNNGYATISVSITDFGDISVNAEYSGSSFFIFSSNSFTKTFDEELSYFDEYSKKQMEDLFDSYSSHPQAAESFFNFKEDISDGRLATTTHLENFINLLSLPYTVARTGQSSFEFRDFAYMDDPIGNANGEVVTRYDSNRWVTFTHQPGEGETVELNQVFDFSHTFTWDEWGWVFRQISLTTLLNDLNLNDVSEFLDWLGSYSEGLVEFTAEGIDYKVELDEIWEWVEITLDDFFNFLGFNTTNILDLVAKFIQFLTEIVGNIVAGQNIFSAEGMQFMANMVWSFGLWTVDWVKKKVLSWTINSVEKAFYEIVRHFSEFVANIIKITTDVIENAGLLGEWNRHVGDLFWHYINGELHLAFEYWVERFPSLEQSKFAMLERVEITTWEIINDIQGEKKANRVDEYMEAIKSEDDRLITETRNEFYEQFIRMGTFLINPGLDWLFSIILGNEMGNPYRSIFPGDVTNMPDQMALTISRMFGVSITGDDLNSLINLLENEYADESINFPDLEIQINEDDYSQKILPKIEDINKPGGLIYSNLGELITKIPPLPPEILASMGESIWEWAKSKLFEIIKLYLDFFAEIDPIFTYRKDWDISMILCMLFLGSIHIVDIGDALELIPSGPNEVLILLLSSALGVCSSFGFFSTENGYKRFIARNFLVDSAHSFIQVFFEIGLQFSALKTFITEEIADDIAAMLECYLSLIDAYDTYGDAEDEYGFADALTWAIGSSLLDFSDAILPFIDQNPKLFGYTLLIETIGYAIHLRKIITPEPESLESLIGIFF